MSYYDSLETRDPAVREADLMDKLRRQLAHAKQASTYYAHVLAGIDPGPATHARRWQHCR